MGSAKAELTHHCPSGDEAAYCSDTFLWSAGSAFCPVIWLLMNEYACATVEEGASQYCSHRYRAHGHMQSATAHVATVAPAPCFLLVC